MEEINNMDTPQPQTANTGTSIDAFGAPEASEGSKENLSVEDAFFGKTESEESAPEGQPEVTQEPVNTEAEAKNDAKRYEYWQSQAAKKDNELRRLQSQVQQAMQAPMPQQQQQAQEEFPPPPSRPEKPRTFSREEAYADPGSESARYLDEVETWRDNIGEYRDLKSQYEVAVVKEHLQEQERQKRVVAAQRAQYAQTNAQKNEVYQHVQGHYGFSPADAENFVKTMSTPDSVSLDNLVQLYRLQQGSPAVNETSQGPSPAFQQSRNAQQVPSPMGVMPSQSTSTQRSDADTIMDDLINTHKSKNPWS